MLDVIELAVLLAVVCLPAGAAMLALVLMMEREDRRAEREGAQGLRVMVDAAVPHEEWLLKAY